MVSPDSMGTACPLSGRNSTYRPVQILQASSKEFVRESPPHFKLTHYRAFWLQNTPQFKKPHRHHCEVRHHGVLTEPFAENQRHVAIHAHDVIVGVAGAVAPVPGIAERFSLLPPDVPNSTL
jgi:hypothetical protein